jgi:hypothetical protein
MLSDPLIKYVDVLMVKIQVYPTVSGGYHGKIR